MEIKKELLDELLKDYKKPEDVIGENGLLKQLTKALLERAMSAELTHHLGYEKSDPAGYNSGNSRNGTTSKTLKGDFGEMAIETPRDRNGSFEPQIMKKHQTRFDGFDDKILSMYARGHDHAGDPGASAGDVRRGGESDADLGGDRRGHGGSEGLAEPAAGAGLWDRLSGCAVCEDAARRAGGEPGGVRGDRHRVGWTEGRAGAMDEQQRRRQVLVGSADGVEEPRGEGDPDRLRGWAERVSASDRERLSADAWCSSASCIWCGPV